MKKDDLKILLVGCGRMGSAMLDGWQKSAIGQVTIIDPTFKNDHASCFINPAHMTEKSFDIMVLAVKPQVMQEVCREVLAADIKASLIVSIAAGKSLSFLENIFGRVQPLIRTMPNTPALIGRGFTVAIGNPAVSKDHELKARDLLQPLGTVEWIEDEKLMDAVTAVSGSGPAYLFLMIEELERAAISQGIAPALAARMARETTIGSAALAAAQPEISASRLRSNVTSPGGTTEAALKILMAEDGLGKLMHQAIEAAAARSGEL